MDDIKLPPPQYLGDVLGYTAEQVRQMVLMERARCVQAADAWSVPSNIKLAAGELTAQELRTAQAVARGISAAIRAQSLRDLARLSEEMGEVK